MMIYMILILFIIVLAFRLYYVENQINLLSRQLSNIVKSKADKKITIGLINKKIEALAVKINELIDLKKQEETCKIKFEKDLRQTIANMSHDLRTPLTSIIGYIQFLKLDNISDEERKSYLQIAEQRAKALERLLNDFYELSLIESLDYELNMERINMTKLLQEIVLGKYADFTNKNIEPEIDILDKNIYIAADGKSLERIIENLLGNSVKYAKGKVKISLKVEAGVAVLIISNTAEDLTAEDVKNVFDRFYMADKNRSGKGTGLGLAIAKGLVEKMGGNIKAELLGDVFSICCSFKII